MQFDLGPQLRSAREAQNLSLRSVASAVGVSASLLSQVETGKTQPSVSTLYALVTHLGLSLDSLINREPSRVAGSAVPLVGSPSRREGRVSDSVVQRWEDNPLIEMENGVTWERLAVGETHVASPIVVTYAPGGSSSMEGKLMRHDALEYGIILEGTLMLKLEFETYVLEPGDSFFFDAHRPHLYVNQTDKPARGVWFVIESTDRRHSGSDDAAPELRRDPRIQSAVDVLNAMRNLDEKS